MSDFDALYGGRYLSATELDKPIIAEIKDVEITSFEKPGEPTKKKALLHFAGDVKPLVVNKTNAAVLAQLFGKNFAAWRGERIELRSEAVFFAGKQVNGVRVYAPKANGGAGKGSAAEELNDEIPF